MSHNRKENLLFYVAGTQAWHALTHLALGITRSKEPHSKLGIRMTPARNIAAGLFFGCVSALLTAYAMRAEKQQPLGRRDEGARPSRSTEAFAH